MMNFRRPHDLFVPTEAEESWYAKAPGQHFSDFYLSYINSPRWFAFRKQAIERVGHRCEQRSFFGLLRCEQRVGLEVHHKHYYTLGRERFGDVKVLCHKHHRQADKLRKGQRGNWWAK